MQGMGKKDNTSIFVILLRTGGTMKLVKFVTDTILLVISVIFIAIICAFSTIAWLIQVLYEVIKLIFSRKE